MSGKQRPGSRPKSETSLRGSDLEVVKSPCLFTENSNHNWPVSLGLACLSSPTFKAALHIITSFNIIGLIYSKARHPLSTPGTFSVWSGISMLIIHTYCKVKVIDFEQHCSLYWTGCNRGLTGNRGRETMWKKRNKYPKLNSNQRCFYLVDIFHPHTTKMAVNDVSLEMQNMNSSEKSSKL